MHIERTQMQPAACHACGAVDTARPARRFRTKACAYCGARRRSKTAETIIDRLLFGT